MRDSAFDFNDLSSSRWSTSKRSRRDGQQEQARFGKARLSCKSQEPKAPDKPRLTGPSRASDEGRVQGKVKSGSGPGSEATVAMQ